MKKILLFLIFFQLFTNQNLIAKDLWVEAKEGDKIILIRHALAPGGGDPPGFKIDDCKTQRNLDKVGIEQSKAIGKLFKKNKIPVDKVLSSQWCRCKDTAKYAFDDFETFDALNSFYDIRFAANEDKQIKDFYEFIDSIDSKNNIVFVTHYVVIGAILNIGTSSGEIVVTDKNLNIIGSIDTCLLYTSPSPRD